MSEQNDLNPLPTVTIRVNGESITTTATNIATLLHELQAPQIGVAVAKNGAVVRRAEQPGTAI
ncbi:MAG: hypothetical protein JWN98_1872, partial [Abditibacteriota bacterium]|nr:hypothetical protein [Abditibacteriota bacterium]